MSIYIPAQFALLLAPTTPGQQQFWHFSFVWPVLRMRHPANTTLVDLLPAAADYHSVHAS
jgi:hypothetical protein